MKKRVYIFVNGILTNPSRPDGWTDRATTWIQTKTDFKAEKFEYFCSAVLKQLWQERRARNLIAMMASYHADGFDIILVGHSNGCDIICRMLRTAAIPVREIHLIAGATSEDCDKNGINDAIWSNRLSSADYYCSRSDSILKAGNNSVLRPLYRLVGYGFLGCLGPQNQKYPGVSATHWFSGYDHSDYFEEGLRFSRTMNLIIRRPKQL